MMWGFISVLGCRVANDNILNNFRLPSAIQNYQLPFIQPWPMSGKVLQFIRLLLIIHRHLVDDSDDGLGVLHAGNSWQLESWGWRGGEQYENLKLGHGVREGEGGSGEGGRGFRSCIWRPPPRLIGQPPVGGRSTQQWSGERKIQVLPVLCSAGREQLGLLVSWECWSCGRAWDIQSPWPHTKSLS